MSNKPSEAWRVAQFWLGVTVISGIGMLVGAGYVIIKVVPFIAKYLETP